MKEHRDFNLRRKARPLSSECLARILRETTTEKDATETYERLTGKKSQKVRKEKEMKLLIEIPTEFESHFNLDRFKDSLKRLEFDANYLAGKYEKELAEMLIESFQNAIPVKPEIIRCKECMNHGKEICYFWSHFYGTINTPDYGFCYKAEWKEENERINKEHEDAK